MKAIIRIFLIGLLLSNQHSSYSQSLKEVIKLALDRNYDLQIIRNNEVIAQNNNTAGNAGQLPTISVYGDLSNSFNNTYQQFADGSVREGKNAQTLNLNVGALANWTVFDGFAIIAKKEQLGYLEQLSKYEARYYIEQTITDLVIAYYELDYQNKLLDNYKIALDISRFRYKIEQRKKEIGSSNAVGYGQSKVDYQNDSIVYLTQLSSIKTLEIELNRIVQNELDQNWDLEDIDYDLAVIETQEELLSKSENNNVDLETDLLSRMLSENALRLEKANRYPTVNIFAGYQLSNTTAEVGFIEVNRNLGPQIGLTVRYDLFKGGQTNTAIKNAELANENALLTTENVKLDLKAQVLTLYQSFQSAQNRLILAKQNEVTMQNVYEVTSQQFKAGQISGYDFRLMQNALLQTSIQVTELNYLLQVIRLNLDRLSGEIMSRYL